MESPEGVPDELTSDRTADHKRPPESSTTTDETPRNRPGESHGEPVERSSEEQPRAKRLKRETKKTREIWRVLGVPCELTKDSLAETLRGHPRLQCLDCPHGPHVLTLAPDLGPGVPKQVATITFDNLPEELLKQGEIVIDITHPADNLRSARLTIDKSFDGPTVLSAPSDAEPKETHSNIVLITGLGGHPIGSFMNKDNKHLWVIDDLPRDRKSARIITYGYRTLLQNLNSFVEIHHLGQNLFGVLDSLLAEFPQPLVLIAHSLGGLIAKEALSIMAGSFERLRLVSGVIFFGVPHRGMKIEHLMPMVNMQPSQPLVLSLSDTSLSQTLIRIGKEWEETLNTTSLKVLCFYETIESRTAQWVDSEKRYSMTGPLQLLVSEASARDCFRHEDRWREHVCGIDKSHSDLVKFSPNDHIYRRVLFFISQISTRIPRTIGFSVTEHFRSKLLSSLRFKQMKYRYQDIDEPLENTCTWICEHNKWQEWANPNAMNPNVFWIKGHAGTGKSTLMKFAAGRMRWHSKFRVVEFFFNARGTHDLEKSVQGLYRSILYDLLGPSDFTLDQLRTVLEFANWDPKLHDPPEDDEWKLLRLHNLLRGTMKSLGGTSLMLFIDALDESDESDIREMVVFFGDLGLIARSVGLCLKVCFASRHYPNISLPENAVSFALEHEKSHAGDIVAYINARLQIQSPNREEICSRIREKASGVFLWVVLVISILNKTHDTGIDCDLISKIEETPAQLNDLFRDIATSSQAKQKRDLLECLRWVLWAAIPLSPTQLRHAVVLASCYSSRRDAVLKTKVEAEEAKRFVLTSSKGLLQVVQRERREEDQDVEEVQFIHESVRNFILSRNGLRDVYAESQIHDKGRNHAALAAQCIEYIRIGNESDDLPLAPPCDEINLEDWQAQIKERIHTGFPLMKYAVNSILFHANTVAKDPTLQKTNFLDRFPVAAWHRCQRLFEDWTWYSRAPSKKASLLYILAFTGSDYIITKELPAATRCFDEEPEHWRCPLMAAMGSGNVRTLEALLRAHATLYRRDPLLYHLHEQLKMDDYYSYNHRRRVNPQRKNEDGVEVSVLENLLEGVACIPAVYAYYSTLSPGVGIDSVRGKRDLTLFAICANRMPQNLKLLERLLNDGANINAKDCHLGLTPLNYEMRFGKRRRQLINFLIQNGADVETEDQWGNTPLLNCVAAHWNSPKDEESIVQLLLDHGSDIHHTNQDGKTPLSYAARKGKPATTQLLLEMGASVSRASETDRSAFWYCLWAINFTFGDDFNTPEYEETARILQEEGQFDSYVDPPLWWAAAQGKEDIVRSYLENGMDVETQDFDGTSYTALWWSARSGHISTVRLLLQYKANVRGSLDTNGIRRTTPLGMCCAQGHHEIAMLLLQAGAGIDGVDYRERTPLSYAAENGHLEVVGMLLHQGAQINHSDGDNKTALCYACIRGHHAVARLLLDNHASTAAHRCTASSQHSSPYDDPPKPPIHHAKDNGHECIVKLLETHASQRRRGALVSASADIHRVVSGAFNEDEMTETQEKGSRRLREH